MKVAYLIMAHHRPLQVARLIERIAGPDSVILLHVDAKTDDAAFFPVVEETLRRHDVMLVPRVRIEYFRFGTVQATLNGIELALRSTPGLDYFSVRTGVDYPIKPVGAVHQVLAESNGTCFMHHVRLPREDWGQSDGGLERLERRWFMFRGRWRCVPTRKLPFVPKRSMPLGLDPYHGNPFWWLPRDALEYVQSFVREHPSYSRFFHRALAPDESFFQMILANSPFRQRMSQEFFLYSDWAAGGTSPSTLTMSDLPNLAASSDFFARKFDEEVDCEVLDRIDTELLGVRPAPVAQP